MIIISGALLPTSAFSLPSCFVHTNGFGVQLMLSLRVYRLYNRAKWIIVFFAVAILARTAAELYIVMKVPPAVTQVSIPFSKISACQPTPGTASHLNLAPIPALIFDIPAFLLVLLQGVSHLKVQRNAGFRGATLIRLRLVRDSIQYFLMYPYLTQPSGTTLSDGYPTVLWWYTLGRS
ncbi:hypothetical protein BDN71DRAFT_1448150 [Pleurotus eryngii]|uniref:Uncharacterized protein n=1 Tax=Pleurotus eryngii TaxID=5323 RepID=A0A9P5ZW86_PLEER|nr:hypothetical protein BDN71DRAFT_1448150 [Pleurotus eryngii]